MESNEQIEVSPFVFSGLENILEEDYELALSDFDKSLETEGENVLVLAYKARLLNKMDRDSEAVNIWKRVLELEPHWDYAQLNKASSLANIGEYKLAIFEYIKLATNPDGRYAVLAILNQAIADYNLEDYESSVKACELVKESGEFDNEIRFWHTWIHSLYPLEDYDPVKFEQVIQEGLKHFPDDVELTSALCIVLNWQEKFKESLSLCEKVLSKDPTDVTTWLYKAQNLVKMKDLDKAYESLLIAISIDDGNLKDNIRENPLSVFLNLNDKRFEELINRN